jgi:hypothetical protein
VTCNRFDHQIVHRVVEKQNAGNALHGIDQSLAVLQRMAAFH